MVADAHAVGLRDLRHHMSEVLGRVRRGETIDVTEHGRVIARIVPVGERQPAPVLARRAYPGIAGFGDPARIAHAREASAGPLQGAVDGRDRGPELLGDFGGTELEYLAEHEHGPLPRRQEQYLTQRGCP